LSLHLRLRLPLRLPLPLPLPLLLPLRLPRCPRLSRPSPPRIASSPVRLRVGWRA